MQLDVRPPPSLLMEIPNGIDGVRATLKVMSALVRGGKKSPAVRAKALALTQHLRQKDRTGEIRALYEYVRDRIRYVRDIHNVETVHTPEQVMRQESGDCDDKAVLLASLLESIGHPSAFWAIGTKSRNQYSHVLVLTRVGPKSWLPLETTEPVAFGWRPPVVRASMIHYN